MEYPTKDSDQHIWDGCCSDSIQIVDNLSSFTSTQAPVQPEHNSSTISFVDATFGYVYNDQQSSLPIADNVTPYMLTSGNLTLSGQLCHLQGSIDTTSDLHPACHGQPSYSPFANNATLDPLLNNITFDPSLGGTAFGPLLGLEPAYYGQPSYSSVANNTTFDPLLDFESACYGQLSDDTSPPTAVDMADLPDCPDMGLPAVNLFAAVPDPAANFAPTTNQRPNIPDPPQATGQGFGSDPQGFVSCGELSVYAGAPTQPRNRFSSIRPKPLSVQPSSANNIPAVTSKPALNTEAPSISAFSATKYSEWASKAPKRKRSVSPYSKRGSIPPERINCFQLVCPVNNHQDRPRPAAKRARSVCIRCQDQHLKCDGVFPCKNCHNYAKTSRRHIELPCIDGDIENLNHFDVFLPFYERILPNDFPDLVDSFEPKHVALLEATETLLCTILESRHDRLRWPRITAFFAYFTLTGIPAREAHTIFTSPPLTPWRITKIKRPNQFSLTFNAASFMVIITQRRSLATLAHLPERDVEIWLSLMSVYFLDHTRAILNKDRRGKASAEERQNLFSALIMLLFASEVRSTYVLQAAQRNFDELLSAGDELLDNGLLFMCDYVLESPDQKKHLRLWARHWLRKQFGGQSFYEMLEPAAICYTLLSCMDLEVDLQCTHEDKSMEDTVECEIEDDKSGEDRVDDASEEDEVDDEVEEDGLAPSPFQLVETLLLLAGKAVLSGSKMQELQQKLDNLACRDLARLFPPNLKSFVEAVLSEKASRELDDDLVVATMILTARNGAHKPNIPRGANQWIVGLEAWIENE